MGFSLPHYGQTRSSYSHNRSQKEYWNISIWWLDDNKLWRKPVNNGEIFQSESMGGGGRRGRFTNTQGRTARGVARFEGSLSPCLSRDSFWKTIPCFDQVYSTLQPTASQAIHPQTRIPDVLNRELSLIVVGQLRDLVAEPIVHAVDPLVVPQTRPGLAPHTP